MPAQAAYQLIHDELNLDGNPALNLASFVTTWMEPEADKLIMESVDKNYVDNDEYPQTQKIEERVVNILARLFNAPEDCQSLGTATIGSSEAIMLALLAHKWKWRERRKAEGKSIENPNIVMGADVHTVWEKFAKYFDVELKLIPLQEDLYTITAEDVASEVDENTIAVGVVVGTTFTGLVASGLWPLWTVIHSYGMAQRWYVPDWRRPWWWGQRQPALPTSKQLARQC